MLFIIIMFWFFRVSRTTTGVNLRPFIGFYLLGLLCIWTWWIKSVGFDIEIFSESVIDKGFVYNWVSFLLTVFFLLTFYPFFVLILLESWVLETIFFDFSEGIWIVNLFYSFGLISPRLPLCIGSLSIPFGLVVSGFT